MKIKWSIALAALIGFCLLGLVSTPTSEVIDEGAWVSGDVAWMLTASALVLLMTPGLAFFYGGMVSHRNVVSTMLQTFTAMGVVSLLWVFVGFSLAFGDSIGGVIGNPFTYFMFKGVTSNVHPDFSPTFPFVIFALFQLKFAIITPALITGAFAERMKFSSYLFFVSLFSLLIYAPLAHWTWHPEGFLHQWGVLDFAGGTVVHMSAGLAALVGAMVIGRRKCHRQADQQGPANVPFVLLGTGMLWFGWFGFNAGSAMGASGLAGEAFLTTNTASAAAMLGWIFFDGATGKKPSAIGACIGAVVGLVAITPAAGFVTVGHSIFIGVSASIICNMAQRWKEGSMVDDTLDVFPCHGVGGIVGMILTAVFAKDVGLFYGETTTFVNHLLALGLVSCFVLSGSYALFHLTDRLLSLRVSEEEEDIGLDYCLHGENMDSLSETIERLLDSNKERAS